MKINIGCPNCSCDDCNFTAPDLKEGETYWCTECSHKITSHYYGCSICESEGKECEGADTVIAHEDNRDEVIAKYWKDKNNAEQEV